MKRVTGIGGIFLKVEDPERLKEWYRRHLGIDSGQYGPVMKWRDKDDKEKINTTTWSVMSKKSDYFNPSKAGVMINYRVENLEMLLKLLNEEGVGQVGEMETFEYGKFAWIMDPDGNKIELWEPADESGF